MNPVERWRASKVYQQELATFLGTPTGKALIDVLYATVPVCDGRMDNVNALIHAGRTNEHLKVIRDIVTLSQLPEPSAHEQQRSDYSEDPLKQFLSDE